MKIALVEFVCNV